mmetsp:Transcript_123469/g.360569  ORF Transcript_123469/g.360569 Transcript_123469/m.360569 type:complete len:113 (-) Transcript_123469:67-405(-)
MSPTMTLNSSCEASRTGASGSGIAAPTAAKLAGGPAARLPGSPAALPGKAFGKPFGTVKLEGGMVLLVPAAALFGEGEPPPKARSSSSGERREAEREAAELGIIVANHAAPT